MDAVRQELARLQQEGYRYAVLDALTEHHLEIQGEALRDAPLVTGGSGLAIGRPGSGRKENGNRAREAGHPLAGRGVVLSGSCSQMTNRRWHITVKLHQPVKLMWHAASQPKLWPLMHTNWQSGFWARKCTCSTGFATASTDALAAIQQQYGAQKPVRQ